jgi:tetratricopeptide (TPR) repeat protein
MLADGMDDFVKNEVSIGEAYGLQITLMRAENPIKGREKYLFYLGNRFSALGDYGRSLECYDRSKEFNPINPSAWFNRAFALIRLGRIEDAVNSYRQAEELFEKKGNQLAVGATLFQLGTIAQSRYNYPQAVKDYNGGLTIWRAVNYQMGIAIILHQLGMIEQTKYNYPEARKLYNQSLEIKRKLKNRSVMAVTLFNLATMELDEEHFDIAKQLFEESLDILKESGDRLGIANTLHQLYKVEYWKGNYPQAKEFYNQSQEIKRELERKSKRPL